MLLLAGLMLGLAVFLVSEVATSPQRRRHLSLKRAASYGARRREADEPEVQRFKERVLVPAVDRLASLALRVNPKTSVDSIGARLIAAGLASRVTTSQFLAVKAGLACGGAVLAFIGVLAAGSVSAGGVVAVFFGLRVFWARGRLSLRG